MTKFFHHELLVIRYAPDAVRDEAVNIGLILLDRRSGSAAVRFTRDWRRVRCLDPRADVEMLEALEAELRERLRAAGEDRDRVLHLLRDSFSNAVQVSPARGLLLPPERTAEEELNRLAAIYLETRRAGAGDRPSERAAIRLAMKDAFLQAGVWDMMRRDIPAAEFTLRGDPLKIDCGYQPNGVIRLFQAMPLAAGVNAAKALAYSYPQIREGVARLRAAETNLTAITEPDLPPDDAVVFARTALESSGISVLTIRDLPAIAARARAELLG
jgi:hypothetical protein